MCQIANFGKNAKITKWSIAKLYIVFNLLAFGSKSPAGMPDQFKIENSGCFSFSVSYAIFGVFGPWPAVAHF